MTNNCSYSINLYIIAVPSKARPDAARTLVGFTATTMLERGDGRTAVNGRALLCILVTACILQRRKLRVSLQMWPMMTEQVLCDVHTA